MKFFKTLNPKMVRGSTGSGLTTAKRGKNQQAGNFRRLEPTTLVMLEPLPWVFSFEAT